MRHLPLILASIFSVILLWNCDDTAPDTPAGPMPLVIEGWIEEGMPPIVMVTRAVDLTSDNASFDGCVERWARVSIWDGDRQYMLTGRINRDYMPPFVYTTSRLHGQVGHTYRLVVETETDTAEAFATMLPSPDITSLEPLAATDSLYSIRACVDGIETDGYYKFFSRTPATERRSYGTFLGTFAGTAYRPADGWSITRGIHTAYDDSIPFSHYYAAGSTVRVSIAAIDSTLYSFWAAYDANISLSQNLLFTFAANLPGNIRGALGYWAAYAPSTRVIRLPSAR